MDRNKKNIARHEEYRRYLSDRMTPKERHDFEKRLLNDDFENEAFDGLSQLSGDGLSTDLKSLRSTLSSKLKRSNSFTFWKVAATLLLLAAFSFSIYYLMDWGEAPDFVQSKQKLTNEDTLITPPISEENEEEGQVIAMNREDKKAPENHERARSSDQKSSVSEELNEVSDEAEMEDVDLDLQVPDESLAVPQGQEAPGTLAEKEANRQAFAPNARKKATSVGSDVSQNAHDVTSFSVQESAKNPLLAPKPAGGDEQFEEYIQKHLKYPELAVKDSIEGTVEVRFTVGIDGQISDIKIVKSLGDDFDQEAIRLIKEGPAWTPAMINGSPITMQTSVKIKFGLPE